MLGEWYRCLVFYANKYPHVQFRNDHPSVIIKQISIKWYKYSDNELLVELTPAENFTEIFQTLIHKYFPKNEPTINLYQPGMLDNLIALLKEINLVKEQIPETLFYEINNIFLYAARKIPSSFIEKHVIPERPPKIGEYLLDFDIDGDPEEEESNPKLKEDRERKQSTELTKLCATDVNPNILVTVGKYSRITSLLFMLAVRARRPELVQILAAYGADCTLRFRDGAAYESPLELILRMQKFKKDRDVANDMLDAINWVRNKPRFSLSDADEIKEIHVHLKNNIIHTEVIISGPKKLDSDSEKLDSYLQLANCILPDDSSKLPLPLQELYILFQDTFHKPYEVFKELFGKDKLVDVIYKDKVLIGFNFFQKSIPNNKEYFTFYCAYSALKKKYRGTRIGTLFAFRVGFCLQKKIPLRMGGVFFFARHYNSFRMIENLKPYPKIQNPVNDDFMVKNVLPGFTCASDVLYKGEGIERSIFDDAHCEPINWQSKSPHERLFNRYMLPIVNPQKEDKLHLNETRSVPTYFLTSEENLEKISQGVRKHNIDFKKHVSELSRCMHKFFNNRSEEKETVRLPLLRSKL